MKPQPPLGSFMEVRAFFLHGPWEILIWILLALGTPTQQGYSKTQRILSVLQNPKLHPYTLRVSCGTGRKLLFHTWRMFAKGC